MSIINIDSSFRGIQYDCSNPEFNFLQQMSPASAIFSWNDKEEIPAAAGFDKEYIFRSYLTNGAQMVKFNVDLSNVTTANYKVRITIEDDYVQESSQLYLSATPYINNVQPEIFDFRVFNGRVQVDVKTTTTNTPDSLTLFVWVLPPFMYYGNKSYPSDI